MDHQNLQAYFEQHWRETIAQCDAQLDYGDRALVPQFTTFEDVKAQILENADPSLNSFHVAGLRPTLRHIDSFWQCFATKLGVKLDSSYPWGLMGTLLQLVSEKPEACKDVPGMIRDIGRKVTLFQKRFSETSQEREQISLQAKEACFDAQKEITLFLANSIHSLRSDEEDSRSLEEVRDEFSSLSSELSAITYSIETLSLSKSPEAEDAAASKNRCIMLPETKASRFFNRLDIFGRIDACLRPSSTNTSFRSVALFGLGGIGKTAIAARYAEVAAGKSEYEAILWIHSEKTESLRQSYTDIANLLGLQGASRENHSDNLNLVQDWYQKTDSKWLAVFDNADTADIFPYWPKSSHGNAIITTRNRSLAFKPATSGLEVFSWDAKTGAQFLLHMLQVSVRDDVSSDDPEYHLSQRVAGHALGLSHMAGAIQLRSQSISRFLNYYDKYSHRAHGEELRKIWAMSFQSLADDHADSLRFLGICAYFMPDSIPDTIFEHERDSGLDSELDFCIGEVEFLYEANALKDLESVCATNLRAIESLHEVDSDMADDLKAHTLSHQANLLESTGRVREAISKNLEGYVIRTKAEKPQPALLAGFENNISYNYNTANEHETALVWYEKCRTRWTQWVLDQGEAEYWPAVMRCGKARCLMLLKDLDEAKQLLDGALAEYRGERPVNWAMLAYGCFTLGLIQRLEGNHEGAESTFTEAHNVWLRGDQARFHPFNGGCLYKIGATCLDQGKVDMAVKHLKESYEITKFNKDLMPVEHARTSFKLSEAVSQDTHPDAGQDAKRYMDEAEKLVQKRGPSSKGFNSESDFDRHIPVFWR